MTVSAEDLAVGGDVIRRFGRRVESSLFHGESPDGDLTTVPALLDEAAEAGFLADSNPARAGFESGAWGRLTFEAGCELTFLTLSSIAESCAGVAAAIHAQGIGCLALASDDDRTTALPRDIARDTGTTMAAAFMPAYGLALDDRTAADVPHVDPAGAVHGCASYVASSAPPDALACFARRARDGAWILAVVDARAPAVDVQDAGRRVGLRAMGMSSVVFDSSPAVAVHEHARDVLARVLACDWLGCAAIALGTARRAIADADAYAAERYQGGAKIIAHASVRMLLAQARHDVTTLDAILRARATEPLATMPVNELLRWAISARLAIGENARRATTNALQVLGGYGYMDDYGISKRLRDVSALASLHGARDQILLLAQSLERNDPRGLRDGDR